MMPDFDVVIMTDLRFPGGSSSSTLQEIQSQYNFGLKTGLYHQPSPVLYRRRHFHLGILNSILEGECQLLNFDPTIKTRILLVRHPSVIHSKSPLPSIVAEKIVLVVNHPPTNAHGRIDYLLPFAIRKLRECYDSEPMVFPIGPLVRRAIETDYDGSINLGDADWLNLFDATRFEVERRSPRWPLRIGRHSRPGKEKWPTSAESIHAAYLADSVHPVFILGGADVPISILGYKPTNWTAYPFGALDSAAFLRMIDVFVYYHHPEWTEAFGRVIAEAMASGLPTILPPHFEPLFKEGAIYCSANDVPQIILKLREPQEYEKASRRAKSFVAANFSTRVHLERLMSVHPGLSIKNDERGCVGF